MRQWILQISFPSWYWRKLCLKTVWIGSIILLVSSMGIYWWKMIFPFYKATHGVLKAVSLPIYANHSGRIELFLCEEGAHFSQGQILVQISDPVLSAKIDGILQDVSACKSQTAEEKIRLDRLMQRYIYLQHTPEIDQILLQIREAQMSMANIETQLQELFKERDCLEQKMQQLQVTAPCDGIVLQYQKNKGEMINPQESLVLICRSEKNWVEMSIPETLLGKISEGTPATIEFSAFKSKKWKGTINWISPIVENGQIKIKVAAPQLPAYPGLSAQVLIKIH